MKMYEDEINIEEKLRAAHNPDIAKIRAEFFEKEYDFFRQHINNQRVLVAGSGLGHDSFELAGYNKKVVGIEFLEYLHEISKRDNKYDNVEFILGDFTKLDFDDKSFDAAVLNMSTIGNIDNKKQALGELLRVADFVYADFYVGKGMNRRKQMYEEEGWQNVRIEGNTIKSDDGMNSSSLSIKTLSEIVWDLGAKAEFYQISDYVFMAKIRN